MKITCQSCQAKYTLADEKVAGKTVKIKCKKCGATIVVSGSEGSGVAAAPAAAAPGAGLVPAALANAPLPSGDDDDGEGATRVFSEGAPQGSPEEWTVNVTDEDQRTLTATQIMLEYQRSVITAETYVWKDGMADWLPLSQVPELMRIVSAVAPRSAAGGSAPRPAAGMPAAAVAPAPAAAAPAPVPAAIADTPLGAMGGTMIMMEGAPSPYAAAAMGNPAPAAGMPAAIAPAAGMPAAAAAAAGTPAPAAARRVGKAGGVDLFAPGAQQQEAPVPLGAAAHFASEKLVGERNENSVLFSISALTASAGAGKGGDDPFDLASPSPKNGRGGVDDLMNLGSGLAAGPILAPPPLLAPVVEAPPPPPQPVAQVAPNFASPTPAVMGAIGAPGMVPAAAPSKSKTPLILAIVGAVVVLGGVGAFLGLKGGDSKAGGSDATSTSSPAETAAPTPSTAAAPADKAAEKPADKAAEKPADKPADTGTQAAEAPSSAGATGPAKVAVGGPLTGRPVEKPAEKPAAVEKPVEKPAEKPADKPAPADNSGSGKEFDRAAAMSALSAAAGAARGCKSADGPTGTARVRITFSPSGSVQSASVDGPPFAGTSVGGCIAAAFRGAHIPAFEGAPQPVSKSVTIN